jgi:hypothetical protein
LLRIIEIPFAHRFTIGSSIRFTNGTFDNSIASVIIIGHIHIAPTATTLGCVIEEEFYVSDFDGVRRESR